jgi:Zn-dependent peptidase ImmA (M78 family)
MQKSLFSLTVAGKKVRVIADSNIEPYALFDPETNIIRVHPSVTSDETLFFETIRHELGHAVMHITGLFALMSAEVQEAIIRSMDSFLFPVLPNASKQVDRAIQKMATKPAS